MKQTSNFTTLKVFGELLGLIIALIFLTWIMPRLSFVTSNYQLWRDIGITAAFINAILKILKHTFSVKHLQQLLEICNQAVSLFSTYMLREIFPFSFQKAGLPDIDSVFRFALGLTVAILSLSIFLNSFKLLFGNKSTKS